MIDTATLLLFCGAVCALLLSPGPNMAFVLAHGAACGFRGGLAAALGIGLADLLLTALTATGVAAAIAAWPPAFDLIRFAGALYLLRMAWQVLRRPGALADTEAGAAGLMTVFIRAAVNSTLNPKALLFFLVFLPQFVDPGKGSVAAQLAMLGVVLTVLSTLFHAALGGVGSSARRLLVRKPHLAGWYARGLSVLLALLALRLLLLQRPA